MLNRLQRILAPPIFDDEERTRTARIINSFAWAAIGILALVILLRIFLWKERGTFSLSILVGIILVLIGVQLIVKRGYIQTASFFLVIAIWTAMTYQAWESDGLRDVTIIAYIVVLLLSSLLLGWRVSLFTGLISVAAIWGFALRESSGLIPLHTDAPLNYARDLTAVFLIVGAFIYLLINGWQRTVQASRVELTERLRAEEKLQTQARYLTALHETTLGLVNRLELNPLLESILAQASELLETPHVCLDLLLPDESALRQELGYGHFESRNGKTAQKGVGLTGRVWQTGRTIVTQNYPEWEGRIFSAENSGITAALGVPLKTGEKVVGTLVVAQADKAKKFTSEQIQLLERIAALASLAIDNAILYEQAQRELNDRRVTESELSASEERFRKVFQASPIAICITTLEEGRLLDANNAYWIMTGYDPETSIGLTSDALDMWETPELRRDFISRIVEKKSIYNPNYEFTTEKNESKSAIAFYELIQLNGETCILSMFYDITAQKQTETALRESESRMSAVLSAIPDMIFEINREGTLTGFIASSDIQPLMPPEDFLGRNIKELFPVSISLQTMFAIERALATNQLHAFEYGMPPGEEVQFFEARVAAISTETAIIMVRDISQRRWVEKDRENLIKELEDKNAELERFTYTVSHDLKSPLITIKGFLGFLEQDATNGNLDRFKSDVKRISDATEKMQALLNELLELSRVGRLMNVFEYIPFEDLAHEAVELVQGRLQSAKIAMTIQRDMPTVYGDRRRLIEVVQNIVDNAAKFTGSQPEPLIEIGQEGLLDGKPIFFVKDNGMGIEPEHLDRIFGLFNKLDASSDGTGIGLTIVKRIIEVHNGRIWVQSEAGKGSTFFFTLQTGPSS
ncbi:MAG: GAF domain-containing protein [Anaerolineales bacterium]|nr:GAF domain-containing protein [Anaerolineales bacterium]